MDQQNYRKNHVGNYGFCTKSCLFVFKKQKDMKHLRIIPTYNEELVVH